MTAIFTVILGLLPVLALTRVLVRSKGFKGFAGEFRVRWSAWLFLSRSEYKALHNVTLPTHDGTTQIDHIFVSRYGIFVVETKNFGGWIFGDPDQATWTQQLYSKTFAFQNPLRQNYKHTQTLAALLGIPHAKIHSVIVFVGNSRFKTVMPDNVTQADGYIRYIQAKQARLFSPSEVDAMVRAIKARRLRPSLATQRAHVKQLEQRHKNRKARRIR
ncbi:Nuclease-related domain-containing protein [Methylomagnum ishizawai]|uniref:Nuclease-related domain-containing protein n=1 Tax=Methylomagnum ishizawai TaxID=1760988 RepID=A0A1Y6D9H9_9GAMM|nr:nuclease-related domain-containing protein [Methylomagnum ishizawai]SMF97042.1 Nuclease-related domain-containing protein [Methylomagnum ishizawai]